MTKLKKVDELLQKYFDIPTGQACEYVDIADIRSLVYRAREEEHAKHHQELQKAREEGYRDGYQRGQRQGEVNVIGHMIGEYNAPYVYDFNLEAPDQSELDQDVSK